jgi:peroxin-1
LISESRIYIDCSKLALGKAKDTRQAIEDCVSEALLHSPSIIIFDDLDSVISVSSDPQVSQSSSSDSLVRYLADIMDEYKVRRCYQITFLNFMNTE